MNKNKVQDQSILATSVFSKQIEPGKTNPPQISWCPLQLGPEFASVHFLPIPGRVTSSVSPTLVIGNTNPAKSWGLAAWHQHNECSSVGQSIPYSAPVLSTYSSCPQIHLQYLLVQDGWLPSCKGSCLLNIVTPHLDPLVSDVSRLERYHTNILLVHLTKVRC